MPRITASLLAAASLVVLASAAATAGDSAPLYTLTASVPLGAPDRWDCVVFDPALQRIFVAHGTEVSVLDAKSLAVVGTLGPFAGGTHGIGIASNGRGYTDDGKGGIAVPFDPVTLKLGAPIPTAADADGIVFDPATHNIFVINGDSGSITAIDPAKDAALGTITLGAGLEFGVADGQGKLYVNGAEKNELIVIDTATRSVTAHWPLAGCDDPHGIALDPTAARVFMTCVNKVMVVVDGPSGAIVATLPIGAYSDGAAFDPVRKLAFSSNGDGTVSVIAEKDANNFVVLDTIKTVPSARTMDIDPATGRLFLAAADIAKIDPPEKPGGRPHVEYVPGSLKLLIFDPAR